LLGPTHGPTAMRGPTVPSIPAEAGRPQRRAGAYSAKRLTYVFTDVRGAFNRVAKLQIFPGHSSLASWMTQNSDCDLPDKFLYCKMIIPLNSRLLEGSGYTFR
jgi:hypothetical protein